MQIIMEAMVIVTKILNWITTVLAVEGGVMSSVQFSREDSLPVFHVDIVRCNFTVCFEKT